MLPGFLYFVSIHTVPPVPRGPVGKVYRDVPEASQILIVTVTISVGKGLTLPFRVQVYLKGENQLSSFADPHASRGTWVTRT